MHVSPSDFKAVRRDEVLLHYAILGEIVYALADLPAGGTRGTFIEEWCEEPHWAFAVSGDLELDLNGERLPISPGTAFHVPVGMRHRLLSDGPARVAGFGEIGPDAPTTDSALRKAGFQVVRTPAPSVPTPTVTVHHSRPERPPAASEILATSRRMGDLLFTRTRLGPMAGYTSAQCDVAHWGLVTSGGVVIESEDGVEVLTSGDVFHCPAGPPGHRLQAADPAIVVDFTPIEGLLAAERLAEWRRGPAERALAEVAAEPRVEVAALL
jgi:quercetin dioxygenase-like cupin family protein